MSRKQKLGILGVFLSLLILCFNIVWGTNGLFDLNALKSEDAVLQQEILARKQENNALYQRIYRLQHDPGYIETIARNELGMVGKNEIIIKFSSDG